MSITDRQPEIEPEALPTFERLTKKDWLRAYAYRYQHSIAQHTTPDQTQGAIPWWTLARVDARLARRDGTTTRFLLELLPLGSLSQTLSKAEAAEAYRDLYQLWDPYYNRYYAEVSGDAVAGLLRHVADLRSRRRNA